MYTIGTDRFSYGIGEGGENLFFRDLRDGKDHLAAEKSYCSYITHQDGSVFYPVSARAEGEDLLITYADGNCARIGFTKREEYVICTLLSVDSEDFLKLAFVNIPVFLEYGEYVYGDRPEAFTATLMGLTCATRMAEHPGRNLLLRAEGYPKIGLHGTRGHSDRPVRAAIFGAPDGRTRDIMKAVIEEIPDGELPKSKKGGPYALDSRDGRRTYSTISSDIRVQDVPGLIERCRRLRITQLSYHQGGGYVQGDFHLIPGIYPNGDADLHRVMEMLHEAGIQVMLHTYTFFLAHNSRYITPVPHPDLDAICHLTLAEDIDENATEIGFLESPELVSETYSYSLVSSRYLKLGDELVRFGSLRHEPPYAFLSCERGAQGTSKAAHHAGEAFTQLKEYFCFILPKADSPLFYEVAKNTADFYNKFGFDGFYMDAIDGVFALEGNEYAWYYAMEFITEVFNHLKSDPVFDCCYNPQYTASFYARSRYGALDHASRAQRAFTDAHVFYNNTTAERMYEPPELGWWTFLAERSHRPGWQTRLMREEDVAYLYNRVVATDASFSYNSNELKDPEKNPMLPRQVSVIQRYEDARPLLHLTPEEKRELCRPGKEYALCTEEGETPFFRPAKTLELHFAAKEGKTAFADVPFEAKKPVLRLFALTGTEQGGEEISLPAPEGAIGEHAECAVRTDGSSVDAGEDTAIRLLVHGDGSGAVLRLRLLRELKGLPQAQADYFVRADFVGWREFSFYETQNEHDPYGKFEPAKLVYRVFTDVSNLYSAYTHPDVFQQLDRVIVDICGEHTDIRVKEITLHRPRIIRYESPSVRIGGQTLRFPCTLESQQAIECDAEGNTVLLDAFGNVRQTLPHTELPCLEAGRSTVCVEYGTEDGEARIDAVLYLVGEGKM